MPFLAAAVVPLFTSRTAINRHLKNESSPPPSAPTPRSASATSARRGSRACNARSSPGSPATWRSTSRTLLPQLTVPVWLGWGRQSIAPPVETADLWLHLLPKGKVGRTTPQLEIFEGSGALPHLEAPVDFCRRLDPFIAEAA